MVDESTIRYANVTELGAALSAARRRAGLSLNEVAEPAGATKNWLWTIEQGRVLGADTTRLIAVAEVLGLTFALVPSVDADGVDK